MSKKYTKKTLFTLDDGLPARPVKSWFREKHRLLAEYVGMFAGPRSRWEDSFFADLYCDYGKCVDTDNGEICDGSTLVALKAMKARGKSFSAVYVNDINADAVESCEKRCRAEGFCVTPLNMDAADAVQHIASLSPKHSLNLAFLDPFSLGTLPFTILDRLSEIGKTDMMAHVSVSDLRRNFGRFSDSTLDGLDRFAPGWRAKYDPNAPLDDNRRAVVDHWTSLLQKRGYLPNDRWKNFPEHRPLIYRLVLMARNQIALKFWNAAIRSSPQKSLF